MSSSDSRAGTDSDRDVLSDSQRRARERYQAMITRGLLSALSTGAIEAVSGAAVLRVRGQRPPAPVGPRSLLSRSGAPTRVVSVSALRPVLRRKKR